MAIQMRGAHPKQLVPGLMGILGQSYKEVAPEHQMLFETQNSSRAYEEEVMTSGFGLAAIKPEGANVAYDSTEELWTARYTHETVALGFMITEEAAEDNLYENYAKKASKGLGKSMAETKQLKAISVLNNAFSSTYKGGDGVALCGTHPTKAGSYSNSVSQDISETSLEAASIALNKWTDDRGLLISVRPQSLFIPVELEFDVERILKSTLRPATPNNDINALNSLGRFSNVKTLLRLTDVDGWFIKTDVTDGLKHFVRRKVRVDTQGDFQTDASMVKMSERYAFGWSDPRQIYGSQGA